jgi:CBS domain-containing protein
MNRDCPTVESSISVQELVDERLLRTGNRCFVVMDDSQVAGLVTPHEISGLERRQWPLVAVERIMKPLAGLSTTSPGKDLNDALTLMTSENVNQLPVVEDHKLVGMLSRSDILRYLQVMMELERGPSQA